MFVYDAMNQSDSQKENDKKFRKITNQREIKKKSPELSGLQ